MKIGISLAIIEMACQIDKDSTFYKKLFDSDYDQCKHSLLVVGPTGAGKSAFCNFILGEKRFKEAIGFIAGTGTVDHCVISFDDGNMLVVDTPGFCDPKRTPDEIIEEICNGAILCRSGIDAIGIVIDPTIRFTETYKIACEQMELFGGDFWKHAFIVFNRENDILEEFDIPEAIMMIDQMKNDPNCPEALILFMNKVGNRFIFVESKKRRHDERYRQQVKDSLLAVVLQLKVNNQGRYFNCFIEHAKRKFDDLSVSRNKVDAEVVSLKAEIEKIEKANRAFKREIIEMLKQLDKKEEDISAKSDKKGGWFSSCSIQ